MVNKPSVFELLRFDCIDLVFYSTDRSEALVPVFVLLLVALWFILRGDLF